MLSYPVTHIQRTQRFLPWYQRQEMKILLNNNLFPRVQIEPTTVTLQSHAFTPAPQRPRSTSFYLAAIISCQADTSITRWKIFSKKYDPNGV